MIDRRKLGKRAQDKGDRRHNGRVQFWRDKGYRVLDLRKEEAAARKTGIDYIIDAPIMRGHVQTKHDKRPILMKWLREAWAILWCASLESGVGIPWLEIKQSGSQERPGEEALDLVILRRQDWDAVFEAAYPPRRGAH